MTNWEENPEQTQNILKWLHILFDLGMTWDSPEWAGSKLNNQPDKWALDPFLRKRINIIAWVEKNVEVPQTYILFKSYQGWSCGCKNTSDPIEGYRKIALCRDFFAAVFISSGCHFESWCIKQQQQQCQFCLSSSHLVSKHQDSDKKNAVLEAST